MQHGSKTAWKILAALALIGPVDSSQVTLAAATLTKLPGTIDTEGVETTPFWFQGQQLLLGSYRPNSMPGWYEVDKQYLRIRDMSGKELSRFGIGYVLGCAFVKDSTINVFAAKATGVPSDMTNDIYRFTSNDGVNWTPPTLAVPRSGSEWLLNSSVCQGPNGYVMAYETNNPVGFCFKFAQSTDLVNWQKVDVPPFTGEKGNEYSACPVIRYSNEYYYAIYLANGENEYAGQYVAEIARSKDLASWEYSEKNPVLAPSEGEGINNSDVDLIEIDGQIYVYYLTGNQASWCHMKCAVYAGPMSDFLASYFPEPVPEPCSGVLIGTVMLGLLGYVWQNRKR